jgi:GNAT superfamily N-acetyltransferase
MMLGSFLTRYPRSSSRSWELACLAADPMAEHARFPLDDRELVLRDACADDVPALVALMADDQLGATRDGIAGADDLEAYLYAFRAIDADPAHLLLVVTDEERIVGTAQLSFLPGLARRGATRAQIEAVRVAADHRSRGLGATMMQWAIDESRRRGCAVVQLTSDRSRTDAHRFYERLGFVRSHEGFKLRF